MKKCWMNRFGRPFRQQIRDRQEKLTLHLPDSVGGRVVEWKYQKQSQAGTILFIAFLFLAGCIWYQDNNLKKT